MKQKFNNNIGKKKEENKKLIIENLKLQERVNKLKYLLIKVVCNSDTCHEKIFHKRINEENMILCNCY